MTTKNDLELENERLRNLLLHVNNALASAIDDTEHQIDSHADTLPQYTRNLAKAIEVAHGPVNDWISENVWHEKPPEPVPVEEDDKDHIDNFVDHGTSIFNKNPNEVHARWMLMFMRFPAVWQLTFAKYYEGLRLFCTHEGKRYRVTMASRFGDIGLNDNFSRDCGYSKRVLWKDCSDWGDKP